MDVTTSPSFPDWSSSFKTEENMSKTEDEILFRRFDTYFPLFWQVVLPFILLFGIFGNVMVIVICTRSEVMSSMSVYFVTLAVSDWLSLIVNTVNQWLYYTFNTSLPLLDTVACKLIMWLVYVTGVLSAWILVAMTAQRAVCVLWPHRANILCSARNSKVIALSLTLFIAVLHCHVLYGLYVVTLSHGTDTTSTTTMDFSNGTHTTNNTVVIFNDGVHTTATNTIVTFNDQSQAAKVCVLATEYVDFYFSVWSWVDLLIFSVLPWLCLVVSNSVLLWTLNVSIRQAQHSLGSAQTDGFSGRKKQASSMTLTLFAVSTAFIVLNLPMSSVQVLGFYHYMVGSLDYFYQSEIIGYCDEIALALWQINSAVNFYLYCLTGSKFRNQLKKTFGCGTPE